jgi:hypothetical protein
MCTTADRTPLGYRFSKVWHPARYQDGRKARGYFEGWYFKCVGPRGDALAVIPGVAIGGSTTDRARAAEPAEAGIAPHAFVQLIRAGGDTRYWEYPVESFRFATDRFAVEVGPNRFSEKGFSLDLAGTPGTVAGEVRFGAWAPWPVRPFAPGIMGWYRFVPFMETYHGVLSMDHTTEGALDIDDETIELTGGRGYVEKDWGRSFPSAWIWAQTNDFEEPGISLTVSVARIPWLGGSFIGYIVGLLRDGVLHEFTTYNGTELREMLPTDDGARIALARGSDELSITLEGAHPGRLRSPVLGDMRGEVLETLEGVALVELRHAGRTVFAGTGTSTGMELMDPDGDLTKVLAAE